MNNLAFTYRAQGKTADAAALQTEALEKRERILGAEHPRHAGVDEQLRIYVLGSGQDDGGDGLRGGGAGEAEADPRGGAFRPAGVDERISVVRGGEPGHQGPNR
jgi:hypothetical protein